jgi:hypothetical protein
MFSPCCKKPDITAIQNSWQKYIILFYIIWTWLSQFINYKKGHSKLHSYLTFTPHHILVCYVVPSAPWWWLQRLPKSCRAAKAKSCAVVGNETSIWSSEVFKHTMPSMSARVHVHTPTCMYLLRHTHSYIMIRMCEHRFSSCTINVIPNLLFYTFFHSTVNMKSATHARTHTHTHLKHTLHNYNRVLVG